ncbi:heavy metal-associated isoprenylated plant protein 39-like [Rutidosis leptorrhynchoides]|uniref:heavy metal-associated isoprenylated plant protein 39-like n=1 Tax=Rutidosis leptorrhynchoides TaxID=125765 RepID=UPI003A9A633D
MDMNEKKFTVIGTVDPVTVVSKLRKYWPTTDIISVGPAKEPEKKEEAKKEETKKEEAAGEAKKEEPKKEEEAGKKEDAPKKEGEEAPKKEEDQKKEDEGKKDIQPAPQVPDPVMELVKAYKAYNPHLTSYYYVQSIEENPNACVIC